MPIATRDRRALLKPLTLLGVVAALLLFAAVPNASAQEDVTPPTLVDFSFTPTTIDTTAGDATVTASAHLTDSQSGVKDCCPSVRFQHPATGQIRDGFLSLAAGTSNDGTFEAQVTFPQFSAAGTWKVVFIFVIDNIGNVLFLSETDLATLGFPTELVNTPDSDGDGVPNALDACPLEAPAGGLDADLDGCTDTIVGLRAIVESLSLKPNIEGGLLGKLDDAQKAVDRGNTRVAENKLTDFINQVEAQRGKALTSAQADLLVSYANNLIALI